jgi:exodeoxyribonuclease VII small subunit
MTNFEEKLSRLEELSENIKRSDISLEDALKNFEEGIRLAKSMEKSLDEMEGKIQILLNNPDADDESEKKSAGKKSDKKNSAEKNSSSPELGLFDEATEINGTRS